jgi:hypothetical protein
VKIRVNGEEYSSWDEVPEEMRRLLAQVMPDDDHDGVPDALQQHIGPGQPPYRRRFNVTARVKNTRVPPSDARPGFRFQMTDAFARALPPEPVDGESTGSATTGPATSATDGPIVLNGVEVGADGTPLKKKRWWSRD